LPSQSTTLPSSPPSSTPREIGAAAPLRAGYTALILLSLGHFTVDLYSSAIGVFQPPLVEKLHLSLTQAGILGGLLVFSSSVTQPLYGILSDRLNSRLFSVLGPAVAAVFITLIAVAPSYPAAIATAMAGGAGIAAFHPQASSWVTRGVQTRRGRWLAVFISAGTLGMAVGPPFFSQIITRFGFGNIPWAMIPGLATAALLLFLLPPFAHAGAKSEKKARDWKALRPVAGPLTVLFLLVFIRSILQITYAQFLPLYLNRERGLSLSEASLALSLYLTAGAIGGFLGGHLSDRWGGKRVILISMVTSVPTLALFFLSSGWLSMLGLALGGLTLLFTIPVNVVMAQELVPAQAGAVSALMMGFAWGMAGLIFIPLTGRLSDVFSLHAALGSLVLFPLAGAVLTLKLPGRY
jgi:MFS transporter, FSR family, fosmidomycin resistance protein